MLSFQEELRKYLEKIENGEVFSLCRYGDGEKMLMCNQAFTGQAWMQDKRKSDGKETKLGNDLKETLKVQSNDYIYAIPCMCCNQICKKRYLQNIKSTNLSFANIFINGNYQTFKRRIITTNKSFHIIANHEGKDKTYPFRVKGFFPLPDDCINRYEVNHEAFKKSIRKVAKEYKGEIFLLSAGPLAKIAVNEMYKANNKNTYIDVGSALDEFTKQRVTRGFQRSGDIYSKKICIF